MFLAVTKCLWIVSQSVCLFVCRLVRLSHLFHYVSIIISSWNFQELIPLTEVMSRQMGGPTENGPPRAWLIFGYARLNLRCSVASDWFGSFCAFADKLLMGSSWKWLANSLWASQAWLNFGLYCNHSTFTALVVIIPLASTKLKGGYTGFTLSVYPSVRLWTESCSLCIFSNTHRILFIFAHLVKQLQKVCRV